MGEHRGWLTRFAEWGITTNKDECLISFNEVITHACDPVCDFSAPSPQATLPVLYQVFSELAHHHPAFIRVVSAPRPSLIKKNVPRLIASNNASKNVRRG